MTAALPPHVTAGEALADLDDRSNPPEPEEVVKGTFEEELRGVPPGDNYLFWTAHRGHPEPRFEWRKRYWTFLLKLHPDRPSPTIQGQPGPWVGPFHWDDRRLRVAELKRLMTFPDEFEVLGTRREQQLQLGNAVPPQLGKVVAEAIAQELARLDVVASFACGRLALLRCLRGEQLVQLLLHRRADLESEAAPELVEVLLRGERALP